MTSGTIRHATERETALRLAALHPDDKAWMLARLPAKARSRLQELLDELDELGFRIDDSALARITGHSHEPSEVAIDPVPDTASSRLMTAHAEQIRALLAREPAAIVHAVLNAQRWPWAADLQAMQDCISPSSGLLSVRTSQALIEAAAMHLPEHREGTPMIAVAKGRTSGRLSAWVWVKGAFGRRIGGVS